MESKKYLAIYFQEEENAKLKETTEIEGVMLKDELFNKNNTSKKIQFIIRGIGDLGFGIGPIPNPQSPRFISII